LRPKAEAKITPGPISTFFIALSVNFFKTKQSQKKSP
jgi:hypothetical protein